MIPSTFQPVPRTQIEYADSFLSSLDQNTVDPAPTERLRLYGQLSPLLVWEHSPEKYQLLTDFQAFRALCSLGLEEIFCRILPCHIQPRHRFAMQILHGMATTEPSPIVQARWLQLAQHQLSAKEVLALLPLMGYKPQCYVLDELLDVLQLAQPAIQAIHQGILAVKTAKMFKLLSTEDQETLVGLIALYRPGGSKQLKLVEMTTELSLRHNRPVHELIEDWQRTTVERKQENGPQQFQNLLQALAESVWPEKTRLEKDFRQFVDTLQLPEGATLVPSQSFEDEKVELRLCFANSDLVRQKWGKIRECL